jgi:glycosyltransferase involved in cell wall biosynthesis
MGEQISVIVPVYNVAPYLKRCVNSICKQTYRELEILLIDDGSVDESGVICDELAKTDDRIRVIHQENGGLSSARNTGLNQCTGEYIAFVDSDDWISPIMIETLYRLCTRYAAQIAECGYHLVYKNGIREETKCTGQVMECDAIEAIRLLHMWKFFRSTVWNKLYHCSVLKGMQFPVGKLHEDEFFTWKALLKAKKLISADTSLYFYDKTRENSITAKISEKTLDGFDAFEERIEEIWSNPKLHSLIESVNNAYTWTAMEKLSQCSKAGITGPRVDDVVKKIQDRYHVILEKQLPIEQRFLDCLKRLETEGIEQAVKYWTECNKE